MDEPKNALKKFLLVGIGAAIAYYFLGPIGLGVIALFFLLKGK